MLRITFTLNSYPCMVSGGTKEIFTFGSPGPRGRIVGHIRAPAGSEMFRRGTAPAKLKIPKPGRTNEYTVVSAWEALKHAKACKLGLEFSEGQDDNLVRLQGHD